MLCVVACLGIDQWAAPGCDMKSMGRMIGQEFESSKSSVEICKNQDVEIMNHANMLLPKEVSKGPETLFFGSWYAVRQRYSAVTVDFPTNKEVVPTSLPSKC